MSYTVQFKFEVQVDGMIYKDKAKELATIITKNTFGEILFKELTEPEVFLD